MTVSALRRLRLPFAAFLAAGLGGLGIGLAVAGGDEDVRERTPRADLAPADSRTVPRIALPATPALRLARDAPTPPAVVRDAPQVIVPVTPQDSNPAPPQADPSGPAEPAEPQLEDDGVIIESPGG